ncbi:hypothetical protein Tco_1360288 [Tanacetum coccineum]
MSTLVFINPESFTQADGAQSSRVLDHAYGCACYTCNVIRSLSLQIAEVAAMSESTFRKRFRSSYESLPFVSPPELPSWKRYRGTSELVEDSEEDEEIEKSLDSNSVGEDAEDKGSTTEDEDPAARDEGLAAEVEGLGTDDESHGLDDEIYGLGGEGHSIESDGLSLEEEEEEAVTRGQQQAALVMGTTVGQGSGSVLESERPERVSASRHPTLTNGQTRRTINFFVRIGSNERILLVWAVKDEIFSNRSDGSHRSSSWACFSGYAGVETEIAVDSLLRRTYREKFFFRFAKVVNNMRRGQEPRGDFKTAFPRMGKAEIVDQVKFT